MMCTTAAELAVYAMIGSLWAELLVAYRYLSRDRRLPSIYRTKAFYLVRGSIALAAGVLPRVFGADTIHLAFSLGVVAPFVISRIPCAFAASSDNHHNSNVGPEANGFKDTGLIPGPGTSAGKAKRKQTKRGKKLIG
jgi:hypothetical protein